MAGPDSTVEYLRTQLQDIGDGLAAAFVTLSTAPHPAACEMLAIRLEGARKHLFQLAEAQHREIAEGGVDGR